MAWAPEPSFPPHVVAEVVPSIIRSKNTIVHHDAERIARDVLAAAAKAMPKLSDEALRALGLARI